MTRKKFYISVDLEGMACVVGAYGKGLSPDTPNYQFACLQGTREANAAATALFDSGADEVYVWDCHAMGVNLDYDKLDKRCSIVMGSGMRKRFPDIDESFGGIVFLGYHAYDTSEATLAHVYSSATFQYQKINGKDVGEMQVDALIAGRYGVPPIFCAGDNYCVAQAKESFDGIVTVETKKALAWNSCISKHPIKCCEEIYEGVKKAAAEADKMKPYTVGEPFEYEVRYKRIEYAQGCTYRDINNNLFERTDAYTRKGLIMKPEHIFEF
ncbi:MAG: M55 family metallopeptidase [Eubacteriales bacterium]|mgnify:CR=1 FL=1|nr:M55 family metallopeptidase [Eubacteriales bacterium]MDD4421891.1 M55 family metallopeptidase [Eubacteriales bacterium]HBR31364.1 peptidase M55 [Clostridiales bacterium]